MITSIKKSKSEKNNLEFRVLNPLNSQHPKEADNFDKIKQGKAKVNFLSNIL